MGAGDDRHREDGASGKEEAKGKACGWLIIEPIEPRPLLLHAWAIK